jgi:hypothetical protein
MPIRINLLAEAQALEDQRRRDPVKRAVWIGIILVLLLLVWSSSLQLQAIIAKGSLSSVNAQISSQTNHYQQVLANRGKLLEVNSKLVSLQQMATNRLLHGTILNALQQATIDEVVLTRVKTDTQYVLNEELKTKTNSSGRTVLGHPASVTEKILLTLDAKDASLNPGDQVNHFKRLVNDHAYFQTMMGKTNEVRLANLSPPQTAEGKPFVVFTLECRYSEKTR